MTNFACTMIIHAILITFFDHLYLPVATHGHVASDYKIETRKPYGGLRAGRWATRAHAEPVAGLFIYIGPYWAVR